MSNHHHNHELAAAAGHSELTRTTTNNTTDKISKNLISRLNELSEPVARKLKFWNKKSFQVNQYDPSFKVIYLGNLGMQFLSKDEQCLEKPLNILWNNYLVYMKTEIVMRLTICNSGLKAITRQHGLTQYWSNRLVYCFTHRNYPKIFSWIYRHEGKKMRQELRCHAVFCPSPEKANKMVSLLNQRLAFALQEFKREKRTRELPSIMMKKSDRSHNLDSNYQLLQQTLPRTIPLRRQILAKGTANFRPPLDRSKSAPKLTSIREEEDFGNEEEEDDDDEELYEDECEEEEGESERYDNDDDLHDEYEFKQVFGDKDDDDEGELNKFVENLINEHNLESDSVITTANKATSNCSSICATGDTNIYDQQQQKQQQQQMSLSAFDRTASIRLSRRSSRRTRSSSRALTNQSSRRSNLILEDNLNSNQNHYQNNQKQEEEAKEKESPTLKLFSNSGANENDNQKQKQQNEFGCDTLSQMLTKQCHISCTNNHNRNQNCEQKEQCQTSAIIIDNQIEPMIVMDPT